MRRRNGWTRRGGTGQPGVGRDPVLLALAAGTALLFGWYATRAGGPRAQVVLAWLVLPVLDVALVVLAGRLGRLAAVAPAPRRFWRATALAGLVYLAADLGQLVQTLLDPTVVSLTPGVMQSALIVLGSAIIVGVALGYPTGAGSRRAYARFLLDAATVMTAAGVVAWCLVTRPSVAAPDALVVAAIGSCLLLVGVFVAVKLGLSGMSPMTRTAATPMVAAALVQGLGGAVIPADDDPGRLVLRLILLLVPAVLMVAGARLEEVGRRNPAAVTRRPARPYSVLPYAATAVTFAVLIAALHGGTGRAVWGAVAGLLVNVALVVTRQVMALSENAVLLGRLDDSLGEIRRREHRLESLLRHASDITTIADPDGRLTYVSPAVRRVLGLDPAEVLGRNLLGYLHPDDLAEVRPRLRALAATAGAQLTYQGRFRHADGSWRWLEVISSNLRGEPGIDGVVSNARDVTDARRLQEQLRHQASHDALTGLANRRLFGDRVTAAGPGPVAVLSIDLDGFKQVNDTYGHQAGDRVLLHVTGRLRDCLRPGDVAARFGGDEFAVLLPGADEAGARAVADRFLRSITEPVDVGGHLVVIEASVGLVVGDPDDAEDLLHTADMRMYRQKRRLRSPIA